MKTLLNWTARRAGASLTINGFVGEEPVKLTGVETIRSAQPHPIAVDRKGDTYQLA